MNAVGICSSVKLILLVLVLLLVPFENGGGRGGVQSKAIGNVSDEQLDNEILVTSSSTEFPIGGTTEETVVMTSTTTTTTTATTTDDVPTIDREHVTLRLPDALFSSTANLTLRLRDLFGQLLMRSVARLAKLMRFIQPLFGGHLVIEIPKELENI